ncbi:MAG: calcium/sodium antiporter [Desulfobacterales bacterium]
MPHGGGDGAPGGRLRLLHHPVLGPRQRQSRLRQRQLLLKGNSIVAQHLIFLFAGLLLLYYGAEWLVNGAVGLARSLGLSPIVIGLTVVAIGTSAPELVVSVVSAFKGKSMIAVGNVIGSNICNIGLVLGLAALLGPITCHRAVVRREIPIMLGVSFYLLLISLNSTIGRIEGATLLAAAVFYVWFSYAMAMRESRLLFESVPGKAPATAGGSRAGQILRILAGITGVVVGAELLVDAAVAMMMFLGVSEKFIGLTVVALGTSLPELATSVVAALKKEMDISVGNLIGSNVFNIISVLGAASLVRPLRIEGGFFQGGLYVDYLVMMGISVLPWFMMRKSARLSRANGAVMLLCYGVYIGYLVWKG